MIIEKNKNKRIINSYLLAKFMEEQHFPDGPHDSWWNIKKMNIQSDKAYISKNNSEFLLFHKEYGWIMPVIDTINNIDDGEHSILICKNFVKLLISNERVEISVESDALFDVCCKFVKWYNYKNKKK